MANVFEQLMALNRETSATPKKVVKVESRKIPVTKIKLESRKIFEEEDLDVIDDKFDVDIDNVDNPENDEVVLVIDPELPAEGEEEPEVAAEDMVGDMVYKCPVCGANYLCDCDHLEEEGIEMDETGAPATCPICGDDADQILVGEIAPAEDVSEEDEVELPPQGDDEESEEEPEDEEEVDFEEDEEVIEDSVKRPFRPRMARREEVDTAGKSRKGGKDIAEFQKELSDAMKKNGGKVPSKFKTDAAKYGFDISDDGQVSVAGSKKADPKKEKEEACGTKDESMELNTRSARRPIPRRPIARPMVRENRIPARPTRLMPRPVNRPLSRPTLRTESLEIDNARFERLMNKFLGENYKGNRTCRLTDAYIKNGSLVLEYAIRTDKGRINGKLVSRNFNSKNASRMRFEDASHTFSSTRGNTFMIESVCRRNNIAPVQISYDFKKKVNEDVYRVKGTHSLVESRKTR